MEAPEEIRAKDILPHKTSFGPGDGFYGDGLTSFFMEAERLLEIINEETIGAMAINNATLHGADMKMVYSSELPYVRGLPIVVQPSKLSWAVTTLSDASNKLIIQGIKKDSSVVSLAQFPKNTLVPSSIEITPQDDVIRYRLAFRADAGETVTFTCSSSIAQLADDLRFPYSTFCGSQQISIVGRNDVIVSSKRFLVIPNAVYKVTVVTPNWDVSGVADTLKMFVRWYDSDGVVYGHNIYSTANVTFADNTIYVKFPMDARGGDIAIRATHGESVKFLVCLDYVENNYDESLYGVSSSKMVPGNASISDNAVVFFPYSSNHSASRAFFKDGFVSAKAGDYFTLKDFSNMSYYIAYSSDGQPPYSVQSWTYGQTIFKDDCKFTVLIRTNDGSYINSDEFAKNAVFVSSNSELRPDTCVKDAVFGSKGTLGLTTRKILPFVGNDSTPVIQQFDVFENSCICIRPSKLSWNQENISGTSNIFIVRYYSSDNEPVDINDARYMKGATLPSEIYVKLPNGVTRFDIFFRADVGESVSFDISYISDEVYASRFLVASDAMRNNVIKSINHRGFASCPEDTLPAYRESARQGFHFVETDIQLTADHKWVCIHDSTIDRTSNGTGAVSSYTLAQLKEFDFGSWKSPRFAGTTIPSFEEFISTCKRLGLSCYVEIKGGVNAVDYIENACDIVRYYGMEACVTWISFGPSFLESVKTYMPSARLGLVVDTITQSAVTSLLTLKNQTNEVFIDAAYSAENKTPEIISLLRTNDIPLEFWVINSDSEIVNLDGYVSGVTSDTKVASNIIYDHEISNL